MADNKTEPEPRITIEQESDLIFWVKVDGRVTDLFMLSELREISDLKQSTREAIDQYYRELREEEE